MRIVVVGRGGREHALAWRLGRSPSAAKVFCAPGNAGTAADAVNVAIQEDDHRELTRFCRDEKIDLAVIGPEAPLTAGLADELRKAGVDVFGPSKSAARLEASKSFCKRILRKANVPTANGRTFTEMAAVEEYLAAEPGPCVVKADGLAAGKGVIVCNSAEDAHAAAKSMLVDDAFGEAGRTILIEERLVGIEASVLAITDGLNILTLEPCQDHKRAFDGDSGPNTGGMGAFCPTPQLDAEALRQIESRILVPVAHQMRKEDAPFCGVLYAGLMLTRKGPQVLEFNVRFGDPECQPLMMRMRGDLARTLRSAARGNLVNHIDYDPRPAVCVVMASGGYPERFRKDLPIRGLDRVGETEELKVFHAGTKRDGDRVLTAGGRVLGITAIGENMAEARERAYAAVAQIAFTDSMYRTDIGSADQGEKRVAVEPPGSAEIPADG